MAGTVAGNLSRARLIALAVPALLLGGALGSQYIGGLFPCEMCYWQRWPHLAAILLALGAMALRRQAGFSHGLTLLAAIAIAVSGGIGVFHAGVEYRWWEGFTTCTASIGGANVQDMLDNIMAAPVIRCDVPQWTLLGISLAGYNAILSLGTAIAILALLVRGRRSAGKARA